MKISEIPEYRDRKKVLTCGENIALTTAAKKMSDAGYGAVVVVKAGKVAGIVTERDLLNKVVAAGKDYKKMKVKDVMTKDVNVAHEDDSITDSLRRMSQGRYRHMPVVDEKDKLIGMVSQGDFVAITWSDIYDRFKSKSTAQFFNYTQLWMMVIVVLAYVTLAPLIIKILN